MNYSIYKTGEKISKLGFGLMRLPRLNEKSEDIDYKEAEKLVDIAIKNGVNYFDTAYGYHDGDSEEFVGKVLTKYPRDSFYLASKLPGWVLGSGTTPKDVFEFQLKRCNVDYFDFYLIHSVTDSLAPTYEKTKSYEFLCKMKKEGKIKNLGFSFHGSLELFERWVKEYEWDFVQIQLNYYDWENQNAKTLYRILEEKNIPCIIMEPVRGGSLHTLNDKARKVFSELSDATPASYALRYAAQLPNVLTVLSGMSNKEQVHDNLKTFSGKIPLDDNEMKAIYKAELLFRENFAIPCTACGYCMESCPNDIFISESFLTYNEHNQSRDKDGFFERYLKIPENSRADLCIECGVCVERCPQNIDIPKQLKRVKSLAADV